MVKTLGFVFNVITKHFYTILTSIEFQWIFNLSIRERTNHAETRGDVLIDFFGAWFIRVGTGSFYWLEDSLEVCILDEWHLELVLPIVKLYE